MGASARRASPEVVQLADHHEVLQAGEQAVNGRVLGGETDPPADLHGLAHHVEAGDARPAVVGSGQRRQDPHGRRLAGPVGAEQPADRPGRHGQVDAGQRLVVLVALAQRLRLDSVGVGHRLLVVGFYRQSDWIA